MKYINLNEVEKIYDAIPSVYNNTVNYNALDFDIHYIEGWRELVMPTYNEDTQFISGAYFLTSGTPYDFFTYPISNRTVEEIAQIQAEKTDALDDAYVLSLEEAGLQVVRRHRKRLRRRVEENTTSFDDAKTVRKLLRPIWQELKDGDFDWALTDAQAIDQSLYNNAVDRETNWLISRIQELIISNPLAKLK